MVYAVRSLKIMCIQKNKKKCCRRKEKKNKQTTVDEEMIRRYETVEMAVLLRFGWMLFTQKSYYKIWSVKLNSRRFMFWSKVFD